MSLIEQAEKDLALTIEGDFGVPVKITDPETSESQYLIGKVRRTTIVYDKGGDMEVTSPGTIVTLRSSSMTTQIKENWEVETMGVVGRAVQLEPDYTLGTIDFLIEEVV